MRRASVRAIESADVNAYLREIGGQDFTAKDFRTWAGTVLAARALADQGPGGTSADSRRKVVRAVERVAEWLHNTPAVARAEYVHPSVVDAYLEGDVIPTTAATPDSQPGGPLPNLGPTKPPCLTSFDGKI